jgi:uncharacterized membrane protein
MKLKIAGYVLLVCQLISLVPVFTGADSFGGRPLPWYIGRFIFGIVGVILLIVAHRRAKKNGFVKNNAEKKED